jgi:hypothetical protein
MKKILQSIRDIVAPPRVVFKATPEDLIAMAANPVIFAPFKSSPDHPVYVPVVGHELSEPQIEACGSFSLIRSALDPKHKLTLSEIKEFSALQHRIVEAWMLRPSYAELLKAVGASPAAAGAHEKLKAMEEQLFLLDAKSPERKALLSEVERLELMADCILPSDFCAFIFSFAVGIGKSDIQKVSDSMCREAAYLAIRGHDNPHDHIGGRFTAFNEKDIDRRSWYLYETDPKRKAS